MVKIGLTGNIATGKSTVSGVLGERGALVIDADQLSREVMQPGSPVHRLIVQHFGRGVLKSDGSLDRAALGRIVFSNADRLAELEALVHPAVAALRDERLRDSHAAVAVLEAVKLVESGQHQQCEELWVVTCSRETQLKRLLDRRGLTREEAECRLNAQPPESDNLRLADVVIRNDGTVQELRADVERHWSRLTQ